VVAERRITDVAQASDPVAALHQRAEDYAPGDTDLTWTRTTPWRTLVAGALDTAAGKVTSASVAAAADDPTAALLRGWLANRLGLDPAFRVQGTAIASVELGLDNGEQIALACEDGGSATLRRTGLPERVVPLTRRLLGDQLAEELRRLDADQPYAAALQAATGTSGLSGRPAGRVHIWYDPASSPS